MDDIAILHGNCIDLLDGVENGSASLVVADPPYNVLDTGDKKVPFQQRNKNVEWDAFDGHFIEFSLSWIDKVIAKLKDDGSMFIFGGVNYARGNDLVSLLPELRNRLHFINLIIWHYENGAGAARFFSSRYELIAWFAKSRDYTFNLDAIREKYDQATMDAYLKDPRVNPANIKKGKNPGNVWHVKRVEANSVERLDHPAQKPEALVKRIVLSASNAGDLVIDPFVGSGTTPRVCKDTGRRFIGFETDERYCRMAIARCSPGARAPSFRDAIGAKENSVTQPSLDDYAKTGKKSSYKRKKKNNLHIGRAEGILRASFHERHHDEDDATDHDQVQHPGLVKGHEEVVNRPDTKCQTHRR